MQVPELRSRHILLNDCPGATAVLSRTVTSATKVARFVHAAPALGVVLGAGLPPGTGVRLAPTVGTLVTPVVGTVAVGPLGVGSTSVGAALVAPVAGAAVTPDA